MRESGAVESARRALGGRLAAARGAAGYSQEALARLADYSRSTIANVETGRQHVPREFWMKVDAALGAGNALIEISDEIQNAVRRERQTAAHHTGPILIGTTSTHLATPAAQLAGSVDALPHPDDYCADVIAEAAIDARERAEKAGVTEIGPGTVEQLTADVVRLGRTYVSGAPLPLFAAMRTAFSRVQTTLERKAYPAQVRDLNFLAGALCGLMANASLDLGREEAADDLARAAWTYGRITDHGPLMGWARGTQALAAIWDHRYLDAVRHAENGLTDLSSGMGCVRLHAIRARALAVHGDRTQARAAMTAARQARSGGRQDELHEGVAGEFAFDDAKLSYYDALTLIDNEDPADAGQAAETAIRLYQAVPVRARSYGCAALAQVQLAKAQLMSRKPERAAETLSGVLTLDPQLRIGSLAEQLATCRQLLNVPAYRSSAAIRQLDRQLAAFSSASAVQALPNGR